MVHWYTHISISPVSSCHGAGLNSSFFEATCLTFVVFKSQCSACLLIVYSYFLFYASLQLSNCLNFVDYSSFLGCSITYIYQCLIIYIHLALDFFGCLIPRLFVKYQDWKVSCHVFVC